MLLGVKKKSVAQSRRVSGAVFVPRRYSYGVKDELIRLSGCDNRRESVGEHFFYGCLLQLSQIQGNEI